MILYGKKYEGFQLITDNCLRAELKLNRETKMIEKYTSYPDCNGRIGLYGIFSLLSDLSRNRCNAYLNEIKIKDMSNNYINIIDYLFQEDNLTLNGLILNYWRSEPVLSYKDSDCIAYLKPISNNILEIVHIENMSNSNTLDSKKNTVNYLNKNISNMIGYDNCYNIKYSKDLLNFENVVALIQSIDVKRHILYEKITFEYLDMDSNVLFVSVCDTINPYKYIIMETENLSDQLRYLANRVINYNCILDNLNNEYQAEKLQSIIHKIYKEYGIKISIYNYSDYKLSFKLKLENDYDIIEIDIIKGLIISNNVKDINSIGVSILELLNLTKLN
ncbi:hypothetical protein [Clostridium senegalense]|uniref:Uncharacterized protein n=1 Tax=Clostridium senegalense TaxID=1465809 RepID=A0A6M0H4L6_9CLOT|nr:hypothetical protein [Clostridium senegalense]NEU05023.1 hypothetical protein [Clostridium senegalense]